MLNFPSWPEVFGGCGGGRLVVHVSCVSRTGAAGLAVCPGCCQTDNSKMVAL